MTVVLAYLLCPIILLNTSKRLLEWIMILKVAEILTNVVPNYLFAPKGNFFKKSIKITFAYLFEYHHPTTFQSNPLSKSTLCYISKKLSVRKLSAKAIQFWSKLGPSCPFLQKGMVWKS